LTNQIIFELRQLPTFSSNVAVKQYVDRHSDQPTRTAVGQVDTSSVLTTSLTMTSQTQLLPHQQLYTICYQSSRLTKHTLINFQQTQACKHSETITYIM